MPKKIDSTTLKQLINDLRAAHGDNLASVVLYGSAAAGDQIELRSDHNLLIALNRITAEDLRLAQAPMREWQDLGQPVPVYFTLAALFGGLLILLGQEPPIAKADTIHATVRLLELDPAPFERILDLRSGKGSSLTEPDANNLFSAYLAQIERVIDAVDRIEGE